jgi:hypothetical protein
VRASSTDVIVERFMSIYGRGLLLVFLPNSARLSMSPCTCRQWNWVRAIMCTA